MPKFRIYVEKTTKARASYVVEAGNADEAINEALAMADRGEGDVEWGVDEWPADIDRWEYAEPQGNE